MSNRQTELRQCAVQYESVVSASPETDRGRKAEVELERARDSINRALAIIPPLLLLPSLAQSHVPCSSCGVRCRCVVVVDFWGETKGSPPIYK
jgi:hypothetical protein